MGGPRNISGNVNIVMRLASGVILEASHRCMLETNSVILKANDFTIVNGPRLLSYFTTKFHL